MPLTCPKCRADSPLIALITETAPIERILVCVVEQQLQIQSRKRDKD